LGSTIATVDADGALSGTYAYDPFGNLVSNSGELSSLNNGQPLNITNDASYGWEGQNDKSTEVNFTLQPIQMGERVYIPALGRFTSEDPIPNGNANLYIYPADPINNFDIAGTNMFSRWVNDIGKYSNVTDIALTSVGIGACVISAGALCVVVSAVTLVASAANAAAGEYYDTKNVYAALAVGIGTGATGKLGDAFVGRAAPSIRQLLGKTEASEARSATSSVARRVAVAANHSSVAARVSKEVTSTIIGNYGQRGITNVVNIKRNLSATTYQPATGAIFLQ
jgi:RHS repeat-associated protein